MKGSEVLPRCSWSIKGEEPVIFVQGLPDNAPWPGYWVMALGRAGGYKGSLSFENFINFFNNEIFIPNNLSHESSGGPLIDNEGYVIGETSWGHKVQQYNGAMSLDGFCAKILECEYEFKGEKTWWDYSNKGFLIELLNECLCERWQLQLWFICSALF